MKKSALYCALMATVFFVSGCEVLPSNSTSVTDTGIDGGPLRDGVASIWVSPDGCQYWVIDDGIEGYMGIRISPVTGLPICEQPEDTRTSMLNKDGSQIAMEPEPQR
ncbi:hypothetical protein [Yoonia sediminilitoris]|uniref:Lipoprotein n=1 Tax=Yoonia sediminilitoris TaxID=1286148 RepID=A0A2T6KDN5_9RHOB|nr:hypothetical protein [Yoonia sediminilitoris]PUB13159.1 hypothetical protein C8N45_10880 [Yoonia sediminilitoris]RCW94494.1 hypothetical protein DFP92_10881 [Yoonia sediminilitoris]